MSTPASAFLRDRTLIQLRQTTSWRTNGLASPLDAMPPRHRAAVLAMLQVNARTLWHLRRVELERRAIDVPGNAALVHHLVASPRAWLHTQPLVRRLVELEARDRTAVAR